MKTHFARMICALIMLAALLSLGDVPGQTLAQSPVPQGPSSTDTIAPGAIPVQGKLTNASGAPLNGSYTLTLSLYEAVDAVDDLCYDVVTVTVVNGLFNTYLDHCYDNIKGQKVWLGIQVDSDPEMTPRQPIYSVPYAISLMPGAQVVTDYSRNLTLSNSNSTGKALIIDTTAATGINYGIYASSASSAGYAGYFYNNSSGTALSGTSVAGTGVYANSLGTALQASSGTGAAISAEGTGVIKSTAKSYVWISGNGVRPYQSSITIEMDSSGGAKVIGGDTAVGRNVMLPITITGPLYGQDVKISAVDIYWVAQSDLDVISAVLLRRQTGVCEPVTGSCYASIVSDQPAAGNEHGCVVGSNPTGCTLHYAPTSNNLISDTSGILYLTIEMKFGGDTNWVKIGGVRLTLEHD